MRVFQAFGNQGFQTIPKLSIYVEELCDRNFIENLEDPIWLSFDINCCQQSICLRLVLSVSSATFETHSLNLVAPRDQILIDGAARETANLNGDSIIFNSGISNLLSSTATGEPGRIQIATPSLRISNGGAISSSTYGNQNAGDIVIDADRIIVTGRLGEVRPSEISSDAFGISTQFERIPARGNAGTITLNTGSLTVNNGATISSFTDSNGNGGKIRIRARDFVEIVGFDSKTQTVSNIGTGAGEASTGRSGDVEIQTPVLRLSNDGRITTGHFGKGNAGAISVDADRIQVDNSNIVSFSRFGNGGDLNLTARDVFLMRHNSFLSTAASINSNGENPGNGGKIAIATNFLVAPHLENNDILASAVSGQGGTVTITARGIFGFTVRNRAQLEQLYGMSGLRSQSDLGTSPENEIISISRTNPTLNGEVRFNAPNVDPSRGTATLPTTITDSSTQLAQVCPRGTNQADRFVVSGRGSVPPSPLSSLTGSATTSSLAEIEGTPANHTIVNATPQSTTPQIVEAQAWIRKPDGTVELVARAPETTPAGVAACPTDSHTSRRSTP